MNFTSKGTREILIAGCQDQMFKVDVEKGIVTHSVSREDMTIKTLLTPHSFLPKPNTL